MVVAISSAPGRCSSYCRHPNDSMKTAVALAILPCSPGVRASTSSVDARVLPARPYVEIRHGGKILDFDLMLHKRAIRRCGWSLSARRSTTGMAPSNGSVRSMPTAAPPHWRVSATSSCNPARTRTSSSPSSATTPTPTCRDCTSSWCS
jgi:hypothetical protein